MREKVEELCDDVDPEAVKNLIVVLDELAKNAIKANHKHLLLRQKMLETLRREAGLGEEEALLRVSEICEDTENYNNYLDNHPELSKGLSEALAAILRQESIWIDLRNKKHSGEQLTEKDHERLNGTDDFRKIYREVQGRRVYVEFRASRNGDNLWIEIINAAPIIRRDLERIEDKRLQFKKHRDQGTEYEFFLTAMDNSEGGSGFGYATIDTHLSSLGIEPLSALRIISVHSTNVMLNVDLAGLKEA